jgi:large subunit ribosomal protein L24
MRKIRIGDEIIVIAGRDVGRRGKVLKISADKKNPKRGLKAVVEGVNMLTKHIRPNPQKDEEGRIGQIEGSIHISNIALYNPITHKADRVGIKTLEDGRKVRYFKSNGEIVDVLEN